MSRTCGGEGGVSKHDLDNLTVVHTYVTMFAFGRIKLKIDFSPSSSPSDEAFFFVLVDDRWFGLDYGDWLGRGLLSGREMFVWLIDEMLRVGRVRRVNSTQQHLRTLVQIKPGQVFTGV